MGHPLLWESLPLSVAHFCLLVILESISESLLDLRLGVHPPPQHTHRLSTWLWPLEVIALLKCGVWGECALRVEHECIPGES